MDDSRNRRRSIGLVHEATWLVGWGIAGYRKGEAERDSAVPR